MLLVIYSKGVTEIRPLFIVCDRVKVKWVLAGVPADFSIELGWFCIFMHDFAEGVVKGGVTLVRGPTFCVGCICHLS